jgi:hypothetical protein
MVTPLRGLLEAGRRASVGCTATVRFDANQVAGCCLLEGQNRNVRVGGSTRSPVTNRYDILHRTTRSNDFVPLVVASEPA